MHHLTLNDLFPSTHKGLMNFARNQSGELVHVDSVQNGLKCNCKCDGCSGILIAKNKGNKQAHYFAHKAEAVDYICKSAGETALHKQAKKYLAERLELTLPELKVTDGRYVEIMPEGIHKFQKAELENPEGRIVPDVVVWRNPNRKLIVEFKVTHECDEYKIAKIRALNIGAIEIDLSEYREYAISELSNIILHKAKRKWLHSPKTADMHKEINKKKSIELENNLFKAEKLVVFSNRKLNPEQQSENKYELLLLKRKLGANYVGFEIGLEGCFLVRNTEWQSALVEYAINHPNQIFDEHDFFEFLLKLNYVTTEFENAGNEVVTIARKNKHGFQRPSETIREFINRSLAFEEPNNSKSKWRLQSEIKSSIEKIAKQKKVEAERLLWLRETVKDILAMLPQEETSHFEFELWLDQTISSLGHSMKTAIAGKANIWADIVCRLAELKSSGWSPNHGTGDIYGLPLEKLLIRRQESRRVETQQKKIIERERLRIEGVNRSEELKAFAANKLGEACIEFLDAKLEILDNLSPTQAAEISEFMYQQAINEVHRKVRGLKLQETKLIEHQLQKNILFNDVLKLCNDSATAVGWCKCTHHQLGSMRPNDYSTTEARRIEAYNVFKRSYKKKSKHLT